MYGLALNLLNNLTSSLLYTTALFPSSKLAILPLIHLFTLIFNVMT